MRKLLTTLAIAGLLAGTLSACDTQADVVSENLSKAADEFEINRRIVFVNGITDEYLLLVEGKCSIGNNDTGRYVTVTCKTSDNPETYKKHYMLASDNVTLIAEQLDEAEASATRYRVVFRPTQIIPDVDVSTDEG